MKESTGKVDPLYFFRWAKPVVLIVEDDYDLRCFFRGNLEKDYTIVEATNGEEGWKKSLENTPEVIVSGVKLSGLDGLELCRRLKTDDRTSHIAVIIASEKASADDRIKGFERGADDYISAPFEAEELRARVKNVIMQRRRLFAHFRKNGILELDHPTIKASDEKFLQTVFGIITGNISNTSFSVLSLAEMSSVGRSTLHRKVVSLTGDPPAKLIRRTRLTMAAQLMEKKGGNISEIALEVGFSNPSYFAQCFRKQYGMSPSRYSQLFTRR